MTVHPRLHAIPRRLDRGSVPLRPCLLGHHVCACRADAFINRSDKSADRGKQYARSHFSSKADDFEVSYAARNMSTFACLPTATEWNAALCMRGSQLTCHIAVVNAQCMTCSNRTPRQCHTEQDDGSDHGTVVLSTSPDSAGLRHRPRSPIIQRMASQRSARSDVGSDLVAHHSLSSALSVDAGHLPEVPPP